MKVVVRAPYQYDVDKASDESGLKCKDPSLAKQEFKEDADINVIVKRFGLTGELPQGVRAPVYGDFTGVADYRQALDAIMEADRSFMALPAEVRARFENDAARFVDFCSDSKNAEEMAKLGLLTPEAFNRVEAAAKAGELARARALVEEQEKLNASLEAARTEPQAPPKGGKKKGEAQSST